MTKVGLIMLTELRLRIRQRCTRKRHLRPVAKVHSTGFFDLPLELRQEIYRLVIESSQDSRGFMLPPPMAEVSSTGLPVCLTVQHRLREEALDTLYRIQIFQGHLPWFGCGAFLFPPESQHVNPHGSRLQSFIKNPYLYVRSYSPAPIKKLSLSFEAGYNYVSDQRSEFYIRSLKPRDLRTDHDELLMRYRPEQFISLQKIRLDLQLQGVPCTANHTDTNASSLILEDIEARIHEVLHQIHSTFSTRRGSPIDVELLLWTKFDFADPALLPWCMSLSVQDLERSARVAATEIKQRLIPLFDLTIQWGYHYANRDFDERRQIPARHRTELPEWCRLKL